MGSGLVSCVNTPFNQKKCASCEGTLFLIRPRGDGEFLPEEGPLCKDHEAKEEEHILTVEGNQLVQPGRRNVADINDRGAGIALGQQRDEAGAE